MRKDWEYKKFGEVCTIERGGSPRPITDFITNDVNGINWIKIGDTKEGSKYITSTKEKIKPEGVKKSRLVHKGDFILSNSMSFGRPYILDIDGCIHDGWLVIHDEKNVFSKDYLYYLLASPIMYSKFSQLAVGGVVNNLNSALVRKVIVPLPPMPTQLTIVAELDTLNEMIRLKKQQLEDYDQLAQSIFYEMFGDPVENEKGWEVKKLGEIAQRKLSYGSGASAIPFDGKIRYIRITDIDESGYLKADIVSPNTIEDKYLLSDGDILFARSGATVGKTFLYKAKYGKCIYAGYLIQLTPNKQMVLPEYVYYYTKSDYYKSFIKDNQKVVAQPNINAQQYGSLRIPLPPLPLQQQFAARIEAIEQQKQQVKDTIKDLETLLASRMQYWFDFTPD